MIQELLAQSITFIAQILSSALCIVVDLRRPRPLIVPTSPPNTTHFNVLTETKDAAARPNIESEHTK